MVSIKGGLIVPEVYIIGVKAITANPENTTTAHCGTILGQNGV
jgi:hypothetical protein